MPEILCTCGYAARAVERFLPRSTPALDDVVQDQEGNLSALGCLAGYGLGDPVYELGVFGVAPADFVREKLLERIKHDENRAPEVWPRRPRPMQQLLDIAIDSIARNENVHMFVAARQKSV